MGKVYGEELLFWMTRFLRTKYETVDIEFIAHHTEAKVVSEEDFFSKGESGGTICSSVYRKSLELIDEKYDPARYNIYPFHFSDGDNLTSDNARCVKLVNDIMKKSNLFCYGRSINITGIPPSCPPIKMSKMINLNTTS